MKKTRKAGVRTITLLLCISIISIFSACNNQTPTNEVSSTVTSSGQELSSSQETPSDLGTPSDQEMKNITADQVDLTLSIPKSWDNMAIILTNSNVTWSSEESKDTLLFELHEKLAYSKDNSIGSVWGLFIFTKDAFANRFGDVDYAEVIGAESYIIGTDKDNIYLLVEPPDVQFLEDDKESQNQYKQLQEESQSVLEDFLNNNQITVNTQCPTSPCYSVTV